MSINCPVCLSEADVGLQNIDDYTQIGCPRCCKYEITGTARAILPNRFEENEVLTRARLSHSIYLLHKIEEWPQIDSTNLDHLVNQQLPSINRQIVYLLEWAANQLEDDHLGAVELPDLDNMAAVVGVVNGDRVDDLISMAERKGLIDYVPDDRISITEEGWSAVEKEMKNLMRDKLIFVKSDDKVVKDDVAGLVTEGMVMTFDSSLPVQPGDRFLRSLPSNIVEEYIVEDPGFQAGIKGHIKPHFQSKVRRSDAPAAPPHTVINSIRGANARVNINSTDNSQNLQISSSDSEIFGQLRERLSQAGLDASKSGEINQTINEMEDAHGSPSFKEKYLRFMSVASDHLGVFGSLLAALAGLL